MSSQLVEMRRGFGSVALWACLGVAMAGFASRAWADDLAVFNFEALTITGPAATTPPGAPFAADSGINAASSTVTGFHASNSTWTVPVGNGSIKSFSSNTWAAGGDYYEIKTSTTGYQNIKLNVDQVSSGTGPRNFKVQYSTDGTTFNDTGFVYYVRANNALPGSPTASPNVPDFTGIVFGDFSKNGVVDAPDYTIWRDNQGSTAVNTASPLYPQEGGISVGAVEDTDLAYMDSLFNSTSVSAVSATTAPLPVTIGPPYFWDQPTPNVSATNPTGAPTGGSTRQLIDAHLIDLSSITAVNNQTNLYLRLTNYLFDGINNFSADPRGNAANVANGGTYRIDNVIISGVPGPGAGGGGAVPEPASVVLMILGGLALVAVRRRRS